MSTTAIIEWMNLIPQPPFRIMSFQSNKDKHCQEEICQRPQSCIRLRPALKCWPYSCLYPKAEDVCDSSGIMTLNGLRYCIAAQHFRGLRGRPERRDMGRPVITHG
ncbi:hypothetical protein I7I51_08352 [Histoplasma capsulatum]|uniref:Uncharacterized protein n=1 Tax=Ajellomyces capsulatus TaxID=5037 RepID=A0A8A1M3A9_AJECA|nr:hypothetical protein I7I51_08352 [Histoplasma capsulatum]